MRSGGVRRYAYLAPTGAPWTVTPLDTVGSPRHSSIAVGSDGVVHVAYWRSAGGSLMYARRAPGATTWTVAVIETTGNLGGWPSIGVSSTGAVHIAYTDETNLELRYATNASGTWQTTALDLNGASGDDDNGSPRSLAIDALDHVHIVYYDAKHGDLRLLVLR